MIPPALEQAREISPVVSCVGYAGPANAEQARSMVKIHVRHRAPRRLGCNRRFKSPQVRVYARGMSHCKLFRVGRSRTGLGLFAVASIAKGMAIVEYEGRRLSTREAHEREQLTGSKYMFELNSRWSIDGSGRRNLARYVNHACQPNAEFELVKGELILRACKPLVLGDEITCDYGSDYFELFIAPFGCRCATCTAK